MRQVFGKVLGVSSRVDRTTYAVTGFSLMAVKYAVEAGVFFVFASTVFTPTDFINPMISAREAILRPAPPWLSWVLYLWTIPFLWISVSMSIRRAADAGLTPWLGFVVLVPLVNLCWMLILCILPSRPSEQWQIAKPAALAKYDPLQAALSVGLSLIVGGLMVWGSIYLLSSYGGSLFLGTPLLMGASAAFFSN